MERGVIGPHKFDLVNICKFCEFSFLCRPFGSFGVGPGSDPHEISGVVGTPGRRDWEGQPVCVTVA